MSMGFLRQLNGPSKGRFQAFLDGLGREPRIAWYPSAGKDFRALMFLGAPYSAYRPAREIEPPPPDLFLYTDYYPWTTSKFLDSPVMHDDGRTRVVARHIEMLPDVDLPLDPEIVDFPKRTRATGKVLFLEVEVVSDLFGGATWPLVYAFCENEAFCARRILAHQARLSHVVHVRYGKGLGGGVASGSWLLNVLDRVCCEVFVSDNHLQMAKGDLAAMRLYPELAPAGPLPKLWTLRRITGKGWSNHGPVTWSRVG